jgi:hypothetical protein
MSTPLGEWIVDTLADLLTSHGEKKAQKLKLLKNE